MRAPSQQAPDLVRPRTRLELMLDEDALEQLRRAQDLMGHQVPSGDPSEIFKRALALLVQHLEQRKYAATESPRLPRASKNPRHIPAHVKRAVRERDRDQCTFVSDTGHRCEETRLLEFDHDREVARGGETTVANVRLRCRAHNQFTAERTYGEGFMQGKRVLAKAKAAARRGRRAAREREDSMRAAAKERALEEIPWLGEMTKRAAQAVTRQPDLEPPRLPT